MNKNIQHIEEMIQLGEEVQHLEEKNCPTNPSKWSYYKSQAKQKFDVYPSAYANGWASKQYKAAGGGWKQCAGESVNELMMPRDVDSKMKELGISKIPISSHGEKILKGMVKEKFLDNVTNKERLVYFVESLGKEKFGYGSKGKPLSPLVDRFWNDITTEAIFFGGKMAAYSVAMNIKDMKRSGEQIDSPYEMLKEYFKNFGMNYSGSRVFNSAIRNLEDWMKRNKIQESVNEAQKINPTSMKFLKGMKKIKVNGLGGYMPGVDYVYVDGDEYYFVDFEGDHMELKNTNTIKQLHKLHGKSLGESVTEDETDPQEIKVGNYQTKYFHVCPGASALYKDIESKGVDMDIAERSARLQDALFFIEEHIQRDGYDPEKDYVMVAKNIAKNIMKMAKMMGLEEEHNYIQGHIDTIEKVVNGGSVNEGNAFTGALFKARKEGLTEFEFNGKKYPVHKLEEEEVIEEGVQSKHKLVRESVMGNIDMLARESDTFMDFMKSFKKEYPEFDYKNKDLVKWLQSTYKSKRG